ncbi:hypothetical protein [Sphaerisporangium sp. TRM90804]|uniref:hypothetical protein n=1 Tax=Sphaerisporangium sp. TRM90804 TaxID=3031113 RepID=UPI002447DC98|nr:hypothetical protein [Sphaerisporangium sp. TRM90804]MDH2425071.1 hypothetical protein [Sphaerisporangium sp. TRM90804]
MAVLMGRTLVEAYLYIELNAVALRAAGDAEGPGESAGDYDAHTTLTEGPEVWRVRFDGRGLGLDLRIDVFVPYRSEFDARRDHLRFGEGASTLIDAGQWSVLSAGYARRALRDDLAYSENPVDPDLFKSVVLGWESARDATLESAKFIPAGADEVPETAFWTDIGKAARRDHPDRFTRTALEADAALYQETLDDFVLTHTTGRPAPPA